MISKQYLITGLIMGIVGIAMSLLFRLQLAWPEQSFGVFDLLLGKCLYIAASVIPHSFDNSAVVTLTGPFAPNIFAKFCIMSSCLGFS